MIGYVLGGAGVSTPCPVCRAPYGFHDDAPHDAASARIPAHLVRISNSEIRRQQKAERVRLPA